MICASSRLGLRMLAFVGTLVAAFALLALFARSARAQQQVEVSAGVDTDNVEVGETVSYTLHAMVRGGGAPSDPKLGSAVGFTVHGATSAPVQMRMNINGVQTDLRGLTTTWSLRAEKVGTFAVGPSQITVGTTKRTTRPVRVTVVPRGQGQPRMRAPSPMDPFGGGSTLDPFKGLFDFGDEPRAPAPEQPTADPKLGMAEPRAPVAFLHATIDKTHAVVGEQITLAVYLYEDPYTRQGRPGDVHEATAGDFVKRSLIEDETRAIGVGTANVGGKLWNVKLVRKSALFPLKTGHLAIDPMSMTLPQARLGLRESERLYVDVVDPPIAGRPAGYALGDVGDMSLQSTVTPRAVPRDGAIGVTLELRGTGNLPSTLTPPVVPGVEWLEPQLRDKLGPAQSDRFGGTRTFSYVVRLHKPGEIDLGEVRLPYYDPDRRAYGIARATLGIVNVADGVAKDAGVEEAEPVLATMPKERHVLEGPRAQTYLAERPLFWALLFGSPLACALVIGAHGLMQRARERRAQKSPSLDRLARDRRAEADDACRAGDGAKAMGAVARAIEADVLALTGVNLRGAAGDLAKTELEDEGVSPATATAIVELLRTCEEARFSPDGVEVASARDVWARARKLIEALRPGEGKAE